MSKQVVINGLLTEYQKNGTGPVVVLLHGWGDKKETFDFLARQLSGTYCVISVDLPGFGNTQTAESAFSLTNYAKFLRDFLHKLEVKDECYALIGHSNGGAIAIKALSMKLMSAEKLVLLASSGLRSEYRASKKVIRLLAKIAKIPALLLPKKMQTSLKKRAYEAIGSELFVAENMQETFKKIISEDIQNDASKISASTFLIYGDEDKATPVRHAEKLHSLIVSSKLEIIPGAGHFVHHSHAERVSTLIQEFLKK